MDRDLINALQSLTAYSLKVDNLKRKRVQSTVHNLCSLVSQSIEQEQQESVDPNKHHKATSVDDKEDQSEEGIVIARSFKTQKTSAVDISADLFDRVGDPLGDEGFGVFQNFNSSDPSDHFPKALKHFFDNLHTSYLELSINHRLRHTFCSLDTYRASLQACTPHCYKHRFLWISFHVSKSAE